MASKKTVTKKDSVSFTSKDISEAKALIDSVLLKGNRGMVIMAQETKDGKSLQIIGGRRHFGLEASLGVVLSTFGMTSVELAMALITLDCEPTPSKKKAVKKVAKKVAKKVTKK